MVDGDPAAGLLVVLEGVLSIDNALVLGLLAKRLPKNQQPKALTYGLIGAFAFRFLAIAVAQFLLKWRFVKLIGGGYLAYISIRHLFFESRETYEEKVGVSETGELILVSASGEPLTSAEESAELSERLLLTAKDKPWLERVLGINHFWATVIMIEFTDIAFAVDSILAAIGVVGPPPAGHDASALHPKLWVVITGGIIGVILMRVAAVLFIKLLETFPRFETAAYLLVAVIGAKLLLDWGFNAEPHPHRLNFHSLWADDGTIHHEFWIFWTTMLLSFLTGFLPQRKRPTPAP
jgi:YkoY family integral membrane protein